MNCKLCFQSYQLQDPRKLPRVLTQCGHTFCDQCIREQMSHSLEILCKDCSKINSPLQDGNFPLNETLISILQNTQQGLCEFLKDSEICKLHGKKLQAYCENDHLSLCLTCILTEHKNHKIISITEKVQKQKDTLKNCERKIVTSQQILKKKEDECKNLIDRLNLDFNEYLFQINLLYKNIINQLKQSEEKFITQTKKLIEKSIKEVNTIEESVKEKKEFYIQLMKICQDLNLKSGPQFISENNKCLFVIENCSIKQNFILSYKKQEIQKQKILNEAIKSLQEFILFERKKVSHEGEKKSTVNNKLSSQNQNDHQQTKQLQKSLKSIGKEDSFSKSITESPCRMQKKAISSVQKNSKQPQILQVNLLEKYEKHMQNKNMKKRNSESLVSKGKSPKIEYEIKRQIDISEKTLSKYFYYSENGAEDRQAQKAKIVSVQINSSGKKVFESDQSMAHSKFNSNKSEDLVLSFLNESHLIVSPQRFRNQNQTFEIQTPLSINSFMESSQCTVFQQKREESLLKDSAASFTIFCPEQKVYHFGGLQNDSISCQKISNSTTSLNLFDRKCQEGLFRSKAQCLILKSYHPKKCLILGGKDQNGQRSKSIVSYDIQSNLLKKCPFELNEAISGFGAVVNSQKIYVFGGSTFSALKTLHEYKLTKTGFQVKKMSSMMNSRDELGFSLGFDEFLYVGGGINSSNVILNSCERYCFKTNKWTSIAAMRHPRRSFTIVSLPNGLYAIGGHDGNSFLKSVEMYDFQSQSWVEVAPMNQGRSTHSAICTTDYQNIIVFGGYQNQPLKTVQVYNIIENKWSLVNEMEKERYLHCSILIQE